MSTLRYVTVYGLLAGLVVAAIIQTGIAFAGKGSFVNTAYFGYLVMLVALTFVFVGVKRYRDVELGGVVRFGTAFLVGLGIAAVAGLAYAVAWEGYLAATDYAFMDDYVSSTIRARQAAGLPPAQLAREVADLEALRVSYRDPLVRLPMTFLEIFPVGLLVALFSALLLRRPGFMPAQR